MYQNVNLTSQMSNEMMKRQEKQTGKERNQIIVENQILVQPVKIKPEKIKVIYMKVQVCI